MKTDLLKNYYSKLAREGWLKAILCGLTVGFTVLFVASAIFWLAEIKAFWINCIVWAGVTAVSAVIFYFAKFRPSKKQLAMRIDELGLEERVLTMTQFEGDNSYIARKQREDAQAALKKADASLLKFAIAPMMCVILGIAFVIGGGMFGVSVGYSFNWIKGGKTWVEEMTEDPIVEYEVIYEVQGDEGGYIEGDIFQLIEEGKNATAVMAVPEDGYVFVEWSDKSTDPYREDLEISENMTITALFMVGEPSEGEPGDGEPGEGEGEPGDQSGDQPGEPGEGEGEGDETDGPPSDQPGDGAGGQHEENNQIIDGNTYYGDTTYDNYKQDAMDRLGDDEEMPDELKEIIKDYYDAIEK